MEIISGNEIRRSNYHNLFHDLYVIQNVHRSFKNKASAVKLRNTAYAQAELQSVRENATDFTHAQLR